jgi:hypothetical protein
MPARPEAITLPGMRWHRFALPFALLFCLAACAVGGAGLGSLVAQGLQALGGDGPSGAPTQSGPFRIPDNSRAMEEIDDLASRAVSQACSTEAGSSPAQTSATADSPAASEAKAGPATAAPDDPDARCGYRPVCFPGNARPVRMLICRSEPSPPAVAQRAAE